MQHQFGAHEIMEAHEVMTGIINSINMFDMLKQQVSDPQLEQIVDKQVNFMQKEYNDMVTYLTQHRGVTPDVYHSKSRGSINYGLRNPSPVSPLERTGSLTDRDISSLMLDKAKCGAITKMNAALECADPELRRMLKQGAISCSEQAYEIFNYMNQKGFYQVPTMQQRTQNTFVNTFQPVATHGTTPGTNQGAHHRPTHGTTTGMSPSTGLDYGYDFTQRNNPGTMEPYGNTYLS